MEDKPFPRLPFTYPYCQSPSNFPVISLPASLCDLTIASLGLPLYYFSCQCYQFLTWSDLLESICFWPVNGVSAIFLFSNQWHVFAENLSTLYVQHISLCFCTHSLFSRPFVKRQVLNVRTGRIYWLYISLSSGRVAGSSSRCYCGYHNHSVPNIPISFLFLFRGLGLLWLFVQDVCVYLNSCFVPNHLLSPQPIATL